MNLPILTSLTMLAFAANSLLNRAALADGLIGPAMFSGVRVAAGVAALLLLLAIRDRALPRPAPLNTVAALALCAYMLGFSFAYVVLDAGLGALILFGGVQVTMFAGGLIGGERPPRHRWVGMTVSLVGLLVLVWPGNMAAPPLASFALMALAAVGWGIYSLEGRRSGDPLRATAWNFTYALPIVVAVLLTAPETVATTRQGLLLAIVSGAVTSGMGYALWYRILPRLGASVAALAQLSVPVIALALGAGLLEEHVSLVAVLSSAMILGGIGVGLVRFRKN